MGPFDSEEHRPLYWVVYFIQSGGAGQIFEADPVQGEFSRKVFLWGRWCISYNGCGRYRYWLY